MTVRLIPEGIEAYIVPCLSDHDLVVVQYELANGKRHYDTRRPGTYISLEGGDQNVRHQKSNNQTEKKL